MDREINQADVDKEQLKVGVEQKDKEVPNYSAEYNTRLTEKIRSTENNDYVRDLCQKMLSGVMDVSSLRKHLAELQLQLLKDSIADAEMDIIPYDIEDGSSKIHVRFNGNHKKKDDRDVFQGITIPEGRKVWVAFLRYQNVCHLYEMGMPFELRYENITKTALKESIASIKDIVEIEDELSRNPAWEWTRSKGTFEAADRFREIKNMPEGPEKDTAYKECKEQLKTQIRLIAKIPEKVREQLRKNPKAMPKEVFDHVFESPESALRFSEKQRIQITNRILDYMEKNAAVAHYSKEYASKPKALLAKVFGKPVDKLHGEVTMKVNGATLFFNCSDSNTYRMLRGKMLEDSGGFTTKESSISELRGTITVGNNAKGNYLRTTMDHEQRHQENKILCPKSTRTPIERAADEIIAYMYDGTDLYTIISYLTKKDCLYDYYKDLRNSAKTVEEKNAINKKWAEHCDEVNNLTKLAFRIGRENLDLLSITPPSKWREYEEEYEEDLTDFIERMALRIRFGTIG